MQNSIKISEDNFLSPIKISQNKIKFDNEYIDSNNYKNNLIQGNNIQLVKVKTQSKKSNLNNKIVTFNEHENVDEDDKEEIIRNFNLEHESNLNSNFNNQNTLKNEISGIKAIRSNGMNVSDFDSGSDKTGSCIEINYKPPESICSSLKASVNLSSSKKIENFGEKLPNFKLINSQLGIMVRSRQGTPIRKEIVLETLPPEINSKYLHDNFKQISIKVLYFLF